MNGRALIGGERSLPGLNGLQHPVQVLAGEYLPEHFCAGRLHCTHSTG